MLHKYDFYYKAALQSDKKVVLIEKEKKLVWRVHYFMLSFSYYCINE